MKKQFDEKQSLALITEMINNTRSRMERNAGRPFLIWGYVTIAVSLAVWYAVSKTGDPNWNFLWFLIPVLGAILMRLPHKCSPEGVKTFIDRVMGYIWLVLGLSAWFVSMLSMFSPYRLPILFIILLLMGIATALSGLVMRFTPCIVGGFLGIGLSTLCLWVTSVDSCLVFAAAFIVMMIIPGHIFNHKSNASNKSQQTLREGMDTSCNTDRGC